MKILKANNECVEHHLDRLFNTPPEERGSLGMIIRDFDDAEFQLSMAKKEPNFFWVSFRIGCFRELRELGVMDKLAQIYGDMLQQALEGWDVTLCVNLAIEDELEQENVIEKVGSLKAHIMSFPIETGFAMAKQGQTGLLKVSYRQNEPMWLAPREDKLAVILAIKLVDEDDKIIGRAFLQELKDFHDPAVTMPPLASLSETEDRLPKVPTDFGDLGLRHTPEDTFFVILVVDDRHFRDSDLAESTCTLIQNYRNFLHYHIKCCKANLHIRQRESVRALMQQLNRAKEMFK